MMALSGEYTVSFSIFMEKVSLDNGNGEAGCHSTWPVAGASIGAPSAWVGSEIETTDLIRTTAMG